MLSLTLSLSFGYIFIQRVLCFYMKFYRSYENKIKHCFIKRNKRRNIDEAEYRSVSERTHISTCSITNPIFLWISIRLVDVFLLQFFIILLLFKMSINFISCFIPQRRFPHFSQTLTCTSKRARKKERKIQNIR